MCFIYAVVICLLTVTSANCQLLSDFPQDVVEDWTSIITNATVKIRICATGLLPPSAPQTEYWIYTRDNPSTPNVVGETDIKPTGSRSKIIFISHGWTQNAASPDIAAIKDAYLVRYDAYVVSVNWATYAAQNYFCAYAAVPAVADNIATSLCNLKNNYGVALEDVHLVGHSLGAHVVGIAGRTVQNKCGVKIGRVTGLDPAGPLYDGIPPIFRLDPDDALFVDVIHTSVASLGYFGSLGQLDAYANCGYAQPGCIDLSKLDIKSILGLPLAVITCSHSRSCYYFAESINSNKFVADECDNCGLPLCSPKKEGDNRKVIGEDDNTRGDVRNYVFNTNASPPYAKG